MSPPHFPIGPDGLRGDWTFERIAPGRHADRRLRRRRVRRAAQGRPHVRLPRRSPTATRRSRTSPIIIPAPDTNAEIARACAGVDLLVHDAQFVARRAGGRRPLRARDRRRRARLSRSSAAPARLALFHHAPARTDDDVEAIGRAVRGGRGQGVEVIVAREEASHRAGWAIAVVSEADADPSGHRRGQLPRARGRRPAPRGPGRGRGRRRVRRPRRAARDGRRRAARRRAHRHPHAADRYRRGRARRERAARAASRRSAS